VRVELLFLIFRKRSLLLSAVTFLKSKGSLDGRLASVRGSRKNAGEGKESAGNSRAEHLSEQSLALPTAKVAGKML